MVLLRTGSPQLASFWILRVSSSCGWNNFGPSKLKNYHQIKDNFVTELQLHVNLNSSGPERVRIHLASGSPRGGGGGGGEFKKFIF
jgi:hypothetical protein